MSQEWALVKVVAKLVLTSFPVISRSLVWALRFWSNFSPTNKMYTIYCYVHSYNVNADFTLTVTLSLSPDNTLPNVTQTSYALIYSFPICITNISLKVNVLMINKNMVPLFAFSLTITISWCIFCNHSTSSNCICSVRSWVYPCSEGTGPALGYKGLGP